MSTPTKATSGCALAKAVRSAASFAHEGHHEAKKLMTTGLPRYSVRSYRSPSSVLPVSVSGSSLPVWVPLFAGTPDSSAQSTTRASPATAAIDASLVLFIVTLLELHSQYSGYRTTIERPRPKRRRGCSSRPPRRCASSTFSAATEAANATQPRCRRSCNGVRVLLRVVKPGGCPEPPAGGLGLGGGMGDSLRLYRCLLYTSPSPRDGLLSRMP